MTIPTPLFVPQQVSSQLINVHLPLPTSCAKARPIRIDTGNPTREP
jgi:hypothetical protein